jgi:thymidylate synthase (FAD)
MKQIKPKVFLIGETSIVHSGLVSFLNQIGADSNFFKYNAEEGVSTIPEIMGRLCYKSFSVGLNPNLTRIREGNAEYLENVINSGHGSVLEHSVVNFIFYGVSRVFTHELVRHRAGVAISQESLRFVRLNELSSYVPMCISENEEGMSIFIDTIERLEKVQEELSRIYEIDDKGFSKKKELTSAFRRVAPMGLATNIGWSCNLRTLRHVIEMRTSESAEEEIRSVFFEVFNIVKDRYPNVFFDAKEGEVISGIPIVTFLNKNI